MNVPAWHAQVAKCVGFDGGLSKNRVGLPFCLEIGHGFTFALGEWTERLESRLLDNGVGDAASDLREVAASAPRAVVSLLETRADDVMSPTRRQPQSIDEKY